MHIISSRAVDFGVKDASRQVGATKDETEMLNSNFSFIHVTAENNKNWELGVECSKGVWIVYEMCFMQLFFRVVPITSVFTTSW